jgi:reverse gyrase
MEGLIMNCTNCNGPAPQHELYEGLCLKCLGSEWEALRKRYNEVLAELPITHNRHVDQLKRATMAAILLGKQRDAAVKAARRWRQRALDDAKLTAWRRVRPTLLDFLNRVEIQ